MPECQVAKGQIHNTRPLPTFTTSKKSLEVLVMDFVVGLLWTCEDSVFVLVGQFSKMAQFITCKNTLDATHVTNII